jgi:hypothetical protein
MFDGTGSSQEPVDLMGQSLEKGLKPVVQQLH